VDLRSLVIRVPGQNGDLKPQNYCQVHSANILYHLGVQPLGHRDEGVLDDNIAVHTGAPNIL
jgi:hypothetical protein